MIHQPLTPSLPCLVLDLLEFLLLHSKFLFGLFGFKGVDSILFFLHDGHLKLVLFGPASPPCHLFFQGWVILHGSSFMFFYPLGFRKLLPFGHCFLLRKSFASGEECGDFRKFHMMFGFLKFMDLFFFGQRLQMSYLLFFGIHHCIEDEGDVFG